MKAKRYFGIHLDPPAEGGSDNVTESAIVRLLEAARADFLQVTVKGKDGVLLYPDSAVSASAGGTVKDAIALYRKVARKANIPLFASVSAGADALAAHEHPDWAAVGADGAAHPFSMGLNSKYVRDRLIPQMKEIIDRYRPDGFWLDLDCEAVVADHSKHNLQRFQKAAGSDTPPTSPDDPRWAAWMELHRRDLVRRVQTYADAVHAHAPGIALVSNGLYSRHCPLPKNSVPTDHVSSSLSATAHAVNEARLDARVLASTGAAWDCAIVATTIDGERGRSPSTLHKTARQICQEAAILLSQGGGVSLRCAAERGGDIPEHVIATVRDVSDFCRQRQRFCDETATVPQVAVLLPGAQGLLCAALDAGHSVDIITDFQLAERAFDYPAILLPAHGDMTDETFLRLKEYVERGGSLLVTGDAQTKRWGDALGLALTEDAQPCQKGRIAAIAEPLGERYAATRDPALRERLAAALKPLYLPTVSILSRDGGYIDLTLRRRGKALVLHLVNLNNAPTPFAPLADRIPAVGPVKLLVRNQPLPKKATCEPEGLPLKVEPSGRNFTLTLPRLHLHATIVL
ncbi:MAG: alpha-L-fucosidase [Kiritimatiellaeota bacterium]|nr:alpha-L-fucosidase [Kiritimatiellota bacterium]